MAQITYDWKVNAFDLTDVPDINKVKDTDMNEIKRTINGINDGTDVVDNLVVGSVQTKNMFGNYLIRNGYISSPAFMRIRDTLTDRMAFVPCEANTTYTVSRSILTTTFRVGEYTTVPPMTNANADYTLPSNIVINNNGTSITYTTGATAKYLIIMYGNITNDSNINESLASIQVEKGSTATTYTPFQNLNPDISSIEQGTFTVNTNYFSTINQNLYVKYGKCVFITFRALCSTNMPNNTKVLDLPYTSALNTELSGFSGTQYAIDTPVWCAITASQPKQIIVGMGMTSGSGKWLHIQFMYITNE